MKKFAIIGAGISGLYFANLLRKDPTCEVSIYEKNSSIKTEKGYGIQLSVNSVKLLNKIGFSNLNLLNQFNPTNIDFYSFKDKTKICDFNISYFNTEYIKYTTLKRSTLIEFLKEKIPSNFFQYNKKIKKIYEKHEKIILIFEDDSSAWCNYLIISDGIFSKTKSLIFNEIVEPKYFNSIAIRGNINKENLKNINFNNVSLFLGPNFHYVIYPVDKGKELNFIGIFNKKLGNKELEDHSLFKDENFISSFLNQLDHQNDKKIFDKIENIKSFPIYASNKINKKKNNKIFTIGDAFFAFPPSFAQGASQSIESAFELFESINTKNIDFNSNRIKRITMVAKRSKFNHFAFHLSNPIMIFIRNQIMKRLIKNEKFAKEYFGKIYNT